MRPISNGRSVPSGTIHLAVNQYVHQFRSSCTGNMISNSSLFSVVIPTWRSKVSLSKLVLTVPPITVIDVHKRCPAFDRCRMSLVVSFPILPGVALSMITHVSKNTLADITTSLVRSDLRFCWFIDSGNASGRRRGGETKTRMLDLENIFLCIRLAFKSALGLFKGHDYFGHDIHIHRL